MKRALLIVSFSTLFIFQRVSAQRYYNPIFPESAIQVMPDVMYGTNYDATTTEGDTIIDTLLLDVYMPPASDTVAARPLILYVHTGSFLPPGTSNGTPLGDKSDSAAVNFCKQWAESGYVAASVNYRLGWDPSSDVPETRLQTYLEAIYRGVQDVRNAIRFLKFGVSYGNPYGIDTFKIAVFGEGSGGYISLACATLDKFSKISTEAKFIDPIMSMPYIDSSVMGNVHGVGGSENLNNYAYVSDNFYFAVNAGGDLLDTSWLDNLQDPIPVVSFQCVRDPLAPYDSGLIIVPATNEDVIATFGSGVIMPIVNSLGNNNSFADHPFTDPYTLAARSKYNLTIPYNSEPDVDSIGTGYGEGLYPFILPIDDTMLDNQSAPWQFWNPNVPPATDPIANSPFTCGEAAMLSNPNMSRTKGLTYIDTMQQYLLPRLVLALDLPYDSLPVADSLVWPGDANDDGIVDANDILQITMAYSSTGPARQNATIQWVGQAATDWTGILNDVNNKYTDCNGDGIINANDTLAVSQNYSLTHNKTNGTKIADASDPYLTLTPLSDTIFANSTYYLQVMLGSATTPVDSLYGLAFYINYDPTIFDTTGIQLNMATSWLGTAGTNLLSFRKPLPGQNQLVMVLSRIDHQNAAGNEQVAELALKTNAHIVSGASNYSFTPVIINGITAGGSPVTFNTQASPTSVVSGINDILVDETLRIYPNPNDGHFILNMDQPGGPLTIEILDVQGTRLYLEQLNDITSLNKDFNFTDLAKGVYFLRITSESNVVVKRLVVQ